MILKLKIIWLDFVVECIVKKKFCLKKYKFIIFSFFKYHQYFLVSSGINESMEIFGHKAYGVELPITAVTVEMGNLLGV